VLKDRAVRFIKDQSATAAPFFMLIATKAVHAEGKRAIPAPQYEQAFKDIRLPMNPAFNEKDVSQKAIRAPRLKKENTEELELSYQAELQSLQSVDDLVEAIVNVLQATGKLNNTVVIYTSDNGFLFGDHRLVGKSAAYEESIKVPLVMRGPSIPAKGRRDQLVTNFDLTATIVELAGASPPVTLDGRSLVPLFADANALWRGAVLIESPVTRFDNPTHRYTAVRTPTRKYIKYDGGFEELFDLTADPDELKNEAGNSSYAVDLATLRGVHDMLKSCAGPSCWASSVH